MVVTLLQNLPSGFWNINITDTISVLVTLGLFVVYWRMKNIQDEQNDIQRTQNQIMGKQAALMSANHRPRLKYDKSQAMGDTYLLKLTNRGNGPAENLHIQCILYEQSKSEDGEPRFRGAYRGTGTVVGSVWLPLNRSTEAFDKESETGQPEGPNNAIEEGESGIWFETIIYLKPMTPGSRPYEDPFDEVMHRLSREWTDVENIAIEFFLISTDLINDPHAIWLDTYYDIPLKGHTTVEEAMENGKLGQRIGDPISEDDTASAMVIEPGDIDFGD